MFTRDEIDYIREITIWDIIVNSSDVSPDYIQKEVFFWNEGDPCPQPVQLNATSMEPCKYLTGYDYFEVSFKTVLICHIAGNFKKSSRLSRICLFMKIFRISLRQCNHKILISGQRISIPLRLHLLGSRTATLRLCWLLCR